MRAAPESKTGQGRDLFPRAHDCFSTNRDSSGDTSNAAVLGLGHRGRDTGTPARCRNILGAAGFVETKVVVEPTSTFFSADQLEGALELAVTNPLYGITPSDAIRIKGLRDEYVAETRSSSVQQAIDAELGAYFVLAYWSRTCAIR
jgi:hypothetical protein